MTVAYVDSSALVKLLVAEPESAALRHTLAQTTAVSSVLAAVELAAVVRRRRVPGGHALAEQIADRLRLLPLSDTLLASARDDDALPALRTLDLLHLLSARAARDAAGVTLLIAYDSELAEAARADGFVVAAPA